MAQNVIEQAKHVENTAVRHPWAGLLALVEHVGNTARVMCLWHRWGGHERHGTAWSSWKNVEKIAVDIHGQAE